MGGLGATSASYHVTVLYRHTRKLKWSAFILMLRDRAYQTRSAHSPLDSVKRILLEVFENTEHTVLPDSPILVRLLDRELKPLGTTRQNVFGLRYFIVKEA